MDLTYSRAITTIHVAEYQMQDSANIPVMAAGNPLGEKMDSLSMGLFQVTLRSSRPTVCQARCAAGIQYLIARLPIISSQILIRIQLVIAVEPWKFGRVPLLLSFLILKEILGADKEN
jgi:hypothetical protein